MAPNKILRKCVHPPLEDLTMTERTESERLRCKRLTRENPGTHRERGEGRKMKGQES